MSASPTTPRPADERGRMAAVRRYDILDTPPDGAFDRVTALAARLLDVPISTISIVDEDRIWFKSTSGIEVDEIGRDPGLCASAVMTDDPHVVTDASIDPRTLDNPLVCGELGLRFYVGIPLRTSDGHSLGTLNVIDVEPREVSDGDIATLEDLAAIVMDELELRLAAKRTIELESLRAGAEFRDAVIAGISHEMRTPLAVLQGIASLPPSDDPEEAAETNRVLVRHVRHLDWLVGQFLDYTRLEADAAPALDLAAVEISTVVDESVEVFAERARIRVEQPSGLPLVRADRGRTRQIVIELLNNAVRFGQGGSITVTLAAEDGEVSIAVQDEGPGIDPGMHEHLFERFHRHDDSTGSGVGLYVGRALAEAQGGALDVVSEPGAGSRFTLTLPSIARSS